MNDKLALWTPEYKKNSNFNSNFDYRKTVETFAATSEIIEKERYFYNGEKFNVDLDGRGLLIKVNPNKFLDIQLGDFIPFQQFQLVLDGLQNGVVDVGIDVNLKDCKIVRYDNSFDLRISNSYNSYLPIISLLLPKTRKRKQQKNIIENTLYYGNRSNCLSVYDKAAEQKLPNNWLRMELRHLKVRNLELSSINEKRYLEYRKSDKQKIMNLVFSNEPIALKDHLLSRFLYLIENESRANQLVKKFGIYCIIELDKNYSIGDYLLVRRGDKNYYRNYKIRTMMEKSKLLPEQLIYYYNELKELLKQSA